MPTDLYLLIHKAQRFHLFRLGEEIGRCDFADPHQAAAVAAGVDAILAHLADHAHTEDTYIHPLFHGLGHGLEDVAREHRGFETAMAGLAAIVRDQRWSELYPSFTRFLGEYLLHTAAEERLQEDILWPGHADAELAAVLHRFKASRPPAVARADLAFVLPALSVPELTRLFQGMKAAAPAVVFDGACELAQRVLDPPRWEQLQSALNR